MELLTVKVPVDFNYFLMGDAHMGSVFHHKKGWEQFVDHVHTKIDGMPIDRNKVTEHGDDCDFIDPKDKRFSAETDKMMILKQIEYAKKERAGLMGHYITKLMGNHEWGKSNFGNITEYLCKELKAPYGGWSCMITFQNKRGEFLFKHFATHGRKGIGSVADDPKRRRVNKQLALKRLLKNKGNFILGSRGHTHWCDRVKPETDIYWSDDGSQVYPQTIKPDATAEYIHPDLRWYVSTGSFYAPYLVQSGVQSYSERADYDPLPCGYMICKIRQNKIVEIEPIWVE